jgi:LruC domain-containing protein
MIKQKTTWVRLLALCSLIALTSCLSESFGELEMDDSHDSSSPEPTEDKYKDFDFKTVHDYQVKIRALDGQDQPLRGAYLEFFLANPLDVDGQLLEDADSFRIFSGVTDANGRLRSRINPALTADSLYILPYYIGLDPLYAVPLQENDINLVLGGRTTNNEDGLTAGQVRSIRNEPPPVRKEGDYYVLGDWHSKGRPDYLEKQDVKITGDFLEDLNEALPEMRPLTRTNPDLLHSEEDANIHLQKDAEVFLTFVSENAGPNNSLGYYTYPTNNPPESAKDLTDLTIIFPVVRGHGNLLNAGNTVQLYYLDQESGTYTATFPKGVSVGWFYIKKGWPHLRSNEMYYSNAELNTGLNDRLRKHNVSIYDNSRERMLVGFETSGRLHRSDLDYNDILFFTSTTPASAIDRSQYFPLKEAPDADSDGVDDNIDAYPDNADRAFDNHYPAKGRFGSLAFEDLWPYRGDYDFNDLVIDYNYNPITNANNLVTTLEARIKVRAIGASFHNAFGVQLNLPQDKIASVNGQNFTKNFLNVRSNGTELNQSSAVIFFFDDAFSILPYPGSGVGINTNEEAPYVEPVEITVTITFTEPVSLAQLGPAPYNSFVVVDGRRELEIHLPGESPTDLADASLFGTGDDDSDIASAKYYMSDDNLPWALNIPMNFEYPEEKRAITNTYLNFDQWAVSRGSQFNDWYEDKSGYKNLTFVYRPN